MMHKAVFIPLTGEDGVKHYMNAYWIANVVDAKDNPIKPVTAIYLIMEGDQPYYVKESADEIVSMIKKEISD